MGQGYYNFMVEFKLNRPCCEAQPVKSTYSPFCCMDLANCVKVFTSSSLLPKDSWLIRLNGSEVVTQRSTETKLELCRTSTTEFFCENC